MAELMLLVDQLTQFKYNQLQLYMEHTFAYSDHKYEPRACCLP